MEVSGQLHFLNKFSLRSLFSLRITFLFFIIFLGLQLSESYLKIRFLPLREHTASPLKRLVVNLYSENETKHVNISWGRTPSSARWSRCYTWVQLLDTGLKFTYLYKRTGYNTTHNSTCMQCLPTQKADSHHCTSIFSPRVKVKGKVVLLLYFYLRTT